MVRYEVWFDGRKKRIKPRELQRWIRNLEEGTHILRRLQFIFDPDPNPLDPDSPYQRFDAGADAHDGAVKFLKELPHGKEGTRKKHEGRPINIYLREAAFLLANTFNKFTSDPHWDAVGKMLADWFPEVKRDQQHKRDTAKYAENLARDFIKRMTNPAERRKIVSMLMAARITNKQARKSEPPPVPARKGIRLRVTRGKAAEIIR